MMISTSKFSKYLFLLSGLLSIFLIAFILTINPGGYLFPSFGSILNEFINLFNFEFLKLFANSLIRLLIVLFVSFIISLIISIIRFYSKNISEFFTPFIVFLKSAPLAILTVYIWFSLGSSKGPYFIIFSVVFPLMTEAFITSIDEIPDGIKQELLISDLSKLTKFFKVIFPMIFPYLMMTFLMTFGLGLKISLMGEYLMQTPDSLGYYIYIRKTDLDSVAILLAILIFCIIFTLVFEYISKVIYKYSYKKLFRKKI